MTDDDNSVLLIGSYE